MANTPRVSIGLPVYNGALYLQTALESILGQTFEDFELIVSDNASTDDTADILNEWATKDRRVRLFWNSSNIGGAANFNRVLDLAQGHYFKWACHDDSIEPNMLETCVDVLSASPSSVILVYPITRLIDSIGAEIRIDSEHMDLTNELPSVRLKEYVRNVNMANPIFGVARTAVVKGTGGIRRFAHADLVTIGELVLRGRMVKVGEPLFNRRIHDDASWRKVGRYEGFADWFDPSHRHRIVFPSWRLASEFASAIFRAPLSGLEKTRCSVVLANEWPRRHGGVMIRDVKRVPGVLIRDLRRFASGASRI